MQEDHYSTVRSTLDPSRMVVGPSAVLLGDPFPSIPTMISTRLQLELLLQDSTIDLTAVSNVILSDAGATLQILRLIGEEYPEEEGRPTRIEDCLVSLNLERWYEAVCGSTIPHNSMLLSEWQHCRLVAHCAKEVAKRIEGFSPEEAYMVGLLYELGRFPHLLGWNRTGETSDEQRALGLMLADYWHLPGYLLSAIKDRHQPHSSSRWNEFLHLVQQLAEQADSTFFVE